MFIIYIYKVYSIYKSQSYNNNYFSLGYTQSSLMYIFQTKRDSVMRETLKNGFIDTSI